MFLFLNSLIFVCFFFYYTLILESGNDLGLGLHFSAKHWLTTSFLLPLLIIYILYILFLYIPILLVISCGHPGSLTNGTLLGDNFTFSHTIHYQCDPGLVVFGSENRTCTASGTWSGTDSLCLCINGLSMYFI